MKIKALWGFFGDAEKLGVKDSQVRAGQEFSKVDPEYAHVLIGKGLVVDVAGQPKPTANKAAKPAENKQTKPADNKAPPTENKAGGDDTAGDSPAPADLDANAVVPAQADFVDADKPGKAAPEAVE